MHEAPEKNKMAPRAVFFSRHIIAPQSGVHWVPKYFGEKGRCGKHMPKPSFTTVPS